MKLLLLGTTGYYPNDRGHTTCLMLPELGVLLDAGTAMFRVRQHLQTSTLDIFLTHTHLDHVSGLTYLYGVLQDRQVERVRVYALADKLAGLDEHLFSPTLFPVKPPYEACPLGKSFDFPDGGKLTHFPLDHPGGSIGYRLDWPDRSLALVTDTTARPDASYIDAIRGVDVLIHECYFRDGFEELAELSGHSCTTPVARVAASAEVGRLILMHVNPISQGDDPIDLATAQAIFPATELGHDEMVVDF